ITMVATILLACGVWTLARTGGFTASDFKNDLHWRWTATPEEQLLAKSGTEPGALPPAAAAAAEPSKERPAPKSAAQPSAPPPRHPPRPHPRKAPRNPVRTDGRAGHAPPAPRSRRPCPGRARLSWASSR